MHTDVCVLNIHFFFFFLYTGHESEIGVLPTEHEYQGSLHLAPIPKSELGRLIVATFGSRILVIFIDHPVRPCRVDKVNAKTFARGHDPPFVIGSRLFIPSTVGLIVYDMNKSLITFECNFEASRLGFVGVQHLRCASNRVLLLKADDNGLWMQFHDASGALLHTRSYKATTAEAAALRAIRSWWLNPEGNHFLVGCQGGLVCLFAISADDSITLERLQQALCTAGSIDVRLLVFYMSLNLLL